MSDHPEEAKSVQEIIDLANGLADRLIEEVGEEKIRAEFDDAGWMVRPESPAKESDVCAVEEELGFALPPSYRNFLVEYGTLTFFGTGDQTTSIHDLVKRSRVTWEAMEITHGSSSPVVQHVSARPRILHLSDYCDDEASVVYLANFVDGSGESPIVWWRNDDEVFEDGDAEELARFERIASDHKKLVRKLCKQEQSPSAQPASTELIEGLRVLLAAEGTQKERLSRIESEYGEAIGRSAGAELLTALHLIRRGIKSPKLRARVDELIGRWRDDERPGAERLPQLASAPGTTQPTPVGFETFEQWLVQWVGAQASYVCERLADSG